MAQSNPISLATPLVDSASPLLLPTPVRQSANLNGGGDASTVVPPIAANRDGRCYNTIDAASAWGHAVHECTAPSDPAHVVVAYIPRRWLRYDGEDDFGVVVVIRVHNTTPIDFAEGVRLELGLTVASNADQDDEDTGDEATCRYISSLGGTMDELVTNVPLMSKEVVFKHELKSGEYITWEVPLKDLPACHNLQLVPSVVYRNLSVEAQDAGVTLVGEYDGVDSDVVGARTKQGSVGENNSGEDDFQVTISNNDSKVFKGTEIQHVRLTCEPVSVPPLIVFQPCPLVFFTDRCGDLDSFRFLWFRFPYQLDAMGIVSSAGKRTKADNPITRMISKMASLTWEGEAIPGGVATNLWAFMTLSGHRLYCVLTENDDQTQQTLHFRGDDRRVLYSIAGSKISREAVVASLLPGMIAAA